jgi:hypothetical protein
MQKLFSYSEIRKKVCFLLVAIIMFSSSCEVDEYRMDKVSTMAGYIQTQNEFGESVDDVSGIKISLDSIRTVVTDTKGFFKFENVKTGVYRIDIEKKGYQSITMEKFSVLSTGDDTIRIKKSIMALSGTVIQNFSVLMDGPNGWPSIQGTVVHNYPDGIFESDYYVEQGSKYPFIFVYCGQDSLVSREHYYSLWSEMLYVKSGGTFQFDYTSHGFHTPSSGETFYYVAYGSSGFSSYGDVPSNVFKLSVK